MDWRRWVYAVPARLRALRRDRFERDLDDELAFHLSMKADAGRRAGMGAVEAGRRARLALGGVEQVKERSRDLRPLRWARDVAQDLQYARRSLVRAPAFTLVIVGTIALGLGANTALFSVVSAVLLRPLPYPDADRLVRVWTSQPQVGLPRSGSALPDYRAWRDENRTFDALGAYHGTSYISGGHDRPEVLRATRVTASLWTVLGREPMHGRLFSSADEHWGGHRVVVLSEGLWRRRFGGDPQAVGRVLHLDGEPFTILGVMPGSFRFPGPLTELWSPVAFGPGDNMDSRNNHFVDMLGRLKPGVTPGEALADLSVIADRLKRAFPENAGVGVTLESWQDAIVGGVRSTLVFLLGAVACVLLIACANVANLLLARAASREHELMVRATIGASRGRLVRQLLTEHLLLAGLGGAAGGLVAYALVGALPALGATGIPRIDEIAIDGRVVGFAAGLAIVTGLVSGLWPARHAGGRSGAGRLSESGRSITGGRRRGRARRVLVTAEVSLSLVLLVGATLLVVSLQRLQQVDPGFDPDRLFTAMLTLPPAQYGDAERVARLVHGVVDGIRALPGIHDAGTTTALPLDGRDWGKYFTIDGRPAPASLAEVPNVSYRQVTPGYLQTMGVALRRGRLLTEQDGPGQPLVAIVNETLARRFWPDGDPVGQLVSMNPPESLLPPDTLPAGAPPLPRRTVVGVIGDIRQNGLDREPNPEVFVPVAQLPLGPWRDEFAQEFASAHVLVARTAGDPLGVTAAIEDVLNRLDPTLPLANVRTMESRLSESMAARRFTALLLSGFAGLAIVLAVVGLYGVISYTVSQRHRELGVRAVMGASAAGLLRLVLTDGLRMTAVGIAIGLLLAMSLSRAITAQLFGIEPIDPALYGAVTVLFVVVAGLACAVPALRAARVEPAAALRCE